METSALCPLKSREVGRWSRGFRLGNEWDSDLSLLFLHSDTQKKKKKDAILDSNSNNAVKFSTNRLPFTA